MKNLLFKNVKTMPFNKKKDRDRKSESKAEDTEKKDKEKAKKKEKKTSNKERKDSKKDKKKGAKSSSVALPLDQVGCEYEFLEDGANVSSIDKRISKDSMYYNDSVSPPVPPKDFRDSVRSCNSRKSTGGGGGDRGAMGNSRFSGGAAAEMSLESYEELSMLDAAIAVGEEEYDDVSVSQGKKEVVQTEGPQESYEVLNDINDEGETYDDVVLEANKSRPKSKHERVVSSSSTRSHSSAGPQESYEQLGSAVEELETYDDVALAASAPLPASKKEDKRKSSSISMSASLSRAMSIYRSKNHPKWVVEGASILPSIFDHPWGICISPTEGDIYITDSDRCTIVKFDKNRNFKACFGSRGSGDGELSSPRGIAISKKGFIVVCDTKNQRIQVFNSSGTFVRKFGDSGLFARPHGVAISKEDEVFVVDASRNEIQVWTLSGINVRTFGSKGLLSQPHDIAINEHTGEVLVLDTSNSRIQIFTKEGVYLRTIGRKGSGYGELSSPKALCLDSEGNILVSDDHNDRVQILTAAGRFVHVLGTSRRGADEGEFDQPASVAVDSDNHVYVCDYFNRRIQVF